MMEEKREELIRKLEAGKAAVAICGLGYLGLLLMLRFTDAGNKAVGED